MLIRPLRAGAAQADHERVGELRVPQPRHVKILGVFEVSLQRIAQRHTRLGRAVKAQRANALFIEHADVVVGRGGFKNNFCRTVDADPKQTRACNSCELDEPFH